MAPNVSKEIVITPANVIDDLDKLAVASQLYLQVIRILVETHPQIVMPIIGSVLTGKKPESKIVVPKLRVN